ncbi:MAG: hypothetical protein C0594_16450 [Marinilabiliales bacterium]|nr:MAG: hypothetical protein C0594_16450 [Marinilabiliales bacterium]
MNLLIKTICLNGLLLFAFTGQLIAQDDSDYISGAPEKSPTEHIIKASIASLVNGDLSLFYERIPIGDYSIEAGAGYIFPYYVGEVPDVVMDGFFVDKPGAGYSLSLQLRRYSEFYGGEKYTGITIRNRNYFVKKGNNFIDLTANLGMHFFLPSKLTLDITLGLGFRFDTQKEFNYKDITDIAPINIKLGRQLKNSRNLNISHFFVTIF